MRASEPAAETLSEAQRSRRISDQTCFGTFPCGDLYAVQCGLLEMNRLSITAVLAILLYLPCAAAPGKIAHYTTTEFSPDQIAVYSFILKSYRTLLKPTYRDMLTKTFYLEDETDPLDLNELERGACLKRVDLEPTLKEEIPTVHRLVGQKWLPPYVRSANGAKCVDSTLSSSKVCWRTEGALSLTEIRFDKTHTHALVGFSVGCGMQCGWGQIVLLERMNGHWHRKEVCEDVYI